MATLKLLERNKWIRPLGDKLIQMDKEVAELRKSLTLDHVMKIAQDPALHWTGLAEDHQIEYWSRLGKYPLVFSVVREGLREKEYYSHHRIGEGPYLTTLSIRWSSRLLVVGDPQDQVTYTSKELKRWESSLRRPNQRINGLYEELNG